MIVAHIAGARGEEPWGRKHFEDHVRKLFFAFWGPSFGQEVIDKGQIEKFQGLAAHIHDTRIRGLYFDPGSDESELPKDAISAERANELLRIASARLEMARAYRPGPLDDEQEKDMLWYVHATQDPERRKLILGRKSMEKLAELGRAAKWMRWLREEFEKADAEARAATEAELARERPEGQAATLPRWKVKIRVVTNSHSIRPKVLNWWNDHATWIKLFPVGGRKDELLAEFTFPSSVPVGALWRAALDSATRLLAALNISTLGYFWWYVPEQVSRFYEDLTDLETGHQVVLERSPSLILENQRRALSEEDLRRTFIAFAMLGQPLGKEGASVIGHYLRGLAFLAKTDLHFQFEANAFEGFFQAFRDGLRLFGEWDGVAPFAETFVKVVERIVPDFDECDRFLKLGKEVEEARREVTTPITLEDAGKMKVLCDGLLTANFQRLAGERANARRKAQGPPESEEE